MNEDTGVASVRHATSETPIAELNHYVACTRMPLSLGEGAAIIGSLEAFYLDLGKCALPTVADGRCGLDVMVQSRGFAQNGEEFQKMRDRLADHLLDNTTNADLIQALVNLGDLLM